MIFDSSDGCHESREGDKLLYHWTKEAQDNKIGLSDQIDDICLCDASINFSNRLNCDTTHLRGPDSSHAQCSKPPLKDPKFGSLLEDNLDLGNNKSLVLYFEKTLVLIREVEPLQSIWMAVHVTSHSISETKESSSELSDEMIFADPNTIPTDPIERVVQNIYERFCLLNGTFEMIKANIKTDSNPDTFPENDESLKELVRNKTRMICDEYFTPVLSSINLHSSIYNLSTLYNYILYIDISPLSLIKVNSFINHVICIDPTTIRHSIVIFNDHLLWSSLNLRDTRLVYNYLVSVPIREALQEELSKEVDKVRRIREEIRIYLTDCGDLTTGYQASDLETPSCSQTNAQQISSHDCEKKRLKALYLTIFRSSNDMTLGLFLSERNQSELLMNCELVLTRDTRLGVVPLASLAQLVGQSFLKGNNSAQSTSQTNTSTGNKSPVETGSLSSSSSFVSKKKIAPDTQTVKSNALVGQIYVILDRIDASITWPIKLDLQRKWHPNVMFSSNNGSGIKWQRLIKWLIEVEPEFGCITRQTGCKLIELLGKLQNDCWIKVTNSNHRTIYSVNRIKNSGLTEALQSAVQLRSLFSNARL